MKDEKLLRKLQKKEKQIPANIINWKKMRAVIIGLIIGITILIFVYFKFRKYF